jgi:hypothetical protein
VLGVGVVGTAGIVAALGMWWRAGGV